MSGLVEGKIGVVTGAGAGIGRECARVFAREGGTVVVSDIDEAGGAETVRLIEETGGAAVFIRCDVAKDADVRHLVAETVRQFGRVDCAHNNAAWEGQQTPFIDETEATFDGLYDVILKGVWQCMKHEIRHMLDQGAGSIVNTGSLLTLKGFPLMGPYCAMKHGIWALTKTAAIEYSAKNVRVNMVSPGQTRTPGAHRAMADTPHMQEYLDVVPAGRWIEPEELGETVVYMLSDRASGSYGANVMVDAGGACL